MAPKNVILALLALCSFAYGQTRSLLVDTSGIVQYTNNPVQWQTALSFGANAAATRSNLSLGLPALTNTSNAGLLTAIGGLATNGSAAGLTNFPSYLMGTNGDASTLTNFPTYLLRTNGDAAALTNFPASLLRTNGNATALTNFPENLLRTNGDGSGLTNLPNANLTNATGVLPLANGGTGATNASNARTALGLGTAATNAATNFQTANTNLTALASGDGSNLTNVTITDASSLTNFPAFLLQTNGSAGSLTNFPSDLMRTNGNAATLTNFPASLLRTNGDGSGLSNVATYPAFSNNASKVLAVNTNSTGVEWVAVSNTVTDAASLTNFPAYLLRTNGSGAGLTNIARPSYTNAEASMYEFLFANSNSYGLNLHWVGGTNASNQHIVIGYGAQVLGTNFNETGVALGTLAQVTNGGIAVGPYTIAQNGIAIGNNAQAEGRGVAIGNYAVAPGGTIDGVDDIGGVAIGTDSTSTTNLGVAIGATAAAEGNGVAVGYDADSRGGTNGGVALGRSADTYEGIAIGARAESDTGMALGNDSESMYGYQIGTGTNNGTNTIQFLGAGEVTTNAWTALANSTTFGRYVMAAPTNGTNGQILALNSNATAVVWTNDGGGTANLTNVTGALAIANGGTGATNVLTALTNLAILGGSSSVHIAPTTTNAVGNFNVTIGVGAFARPNATGSVSIGYQASVDDGGENGGIAIGRGAVCTNGVAIGYGSANLVGTGGRGVAIGYLATNSATGGAQIGTGRNTNASTIQFLSAGSVNTNKWNYLANASTAGGSRMTNTNGVTATNTIIGYNGTNYTTNTITVIDGIITSWTQ